MSTVSRDLTAINEPMMAVENEAVEAFDGAENSNISESAKNFVHKSHAKILKSKGEQNAKHSLLLPAMFQSGIDPALAMMEAYPEKSCLKGPSSTQPAWRPVKKVEFTKDTVEPVPTAASHSLKRALFGQSNVPCVVDQVGKQPTTASPTTALVVKSCLKKSSAYPEEHLTGKRIKSVRFLDSRGERVYFEPDAYESDTCPEEDDDEPTLHDSLMFSHEDYIVDRNIHEAEANRDKCHLMASDNMAFKMLVTKTPEERQRYRIAQMNRRMAMKLRR